MKAILALALAATALPAMAQTEKLDGSTTLAGVVADSIIGAGLSQQLVYEPHGSGDGEARMLAGQQGIAPMSKPINVAAAQAKGITPIDHVIALDGVALWVNASTTVHAVTFDTLRKIYSCTFTKWEQVPGSSQTGDIKVYGRDKASGTTDTFSSLSGATTFGPCVHVLPESNDIGEIVASEAGSIGYAGLSASRDGNKALAVAKDDNSPAKLPTVASIRSRTYPLARELHIYEATGAVTPSPAERLLLNRLTNRSITDAVVDGYHFVTLSN